MAKAKAAAMPVVVLHWVMLVAAYVIPLAIMAATLKL